MLDTKRQRKAVMTWNDCWDRSLASDDRSWLGREAVLEVRRQLGKQIDEYDQRTVIHPEVSPL